MYRYKEIKELLRNNEFLMVIAKDGDGCTIKTPGMLVGDEFVHGHTTSVRIVRGAESGISYTSSRDLLRRQHFIAVPEYAIRLFIISEATTCGMGVGLDIELLTVMDGDDEVDELESIIPDPESEEERRKESDFIRIYIEARKNGFPAEFDDVALSRGVYEGYKICKSFYLEN